jgi:3-dehydroquinate synthase
MKPIKLTVKTPSKKYSILIGRNTVSKISNIIQNNSINFDKCLLVIDKNVPSKMIKKMKKSLKNRKIYFYFFSASEKNKNQKNVDKILKFLLDKNFSRKDCLIAVGGGITGDVSGFAASTFKRGMQFINMPTTLLSQVDSSIGGKTGINTIHGKNLIGSFYHPNLVITDIDFLKSISKREVICGYGEMLKHSLIASKNYYKFLNKNFFEIINLNPPFIEKAIYESCKIKKRVVEQDDKEKSLRKILNFGHTFAHAYEATLGYSKKLNHGEAVILGISTALRFSLDKKLLPLVDYNYILDDFKISKLPLDPKKYFTLKDINKILSFMSKDKKNDTEKINLVLLKKIGLPIRDGLYTRDNLKLFFNRTLVN